MTMLMTKLLFPLILTASLPQNHLNLMKHWYTKWRLKVNQSKSVHTTLTLRPAPCPPVTIYNTQIPILPSVKYLGLTQDIR
ncbi:Hypothetical protein CINCED_3A008585 [Cinara cedri]|uniref:Reverse transcriptase domain n=1 Tax=Cinara cedri TaxID=506608 RepID=A0A5E4MH81_9HEMI|nr:Hypothetical protein CINCED_3A008585 [Cinara cedri]